MKHLTIAAMATVLACPMLTRAEPAPGDNHQRGAPPPAQGTRAALFNVRSYDAANHTVDVVMSSGAVVRRYFGNEVLAITPDAVDLGRVGRNLVPFLNAHNQWDIGAVLGRTISARIEGTELVGTVQFAQTPAGIEAEGMVSRSEVTGISIGYVVRTWQLTESTEDIDTWTAASWELLEVSLVPVPADANAGVRSVVAPPGNSAANGVVKEEEDMLTRNAGGQPAAPAVVTVVTPPAPDTSRSIVGIAAIRSAVTNAGLGDAVAFELIERHETTPLTSDALMADIGRRFAERDAGAAATTVNRVTVTRDAGDTMRRGMEDALLHRLNPTGELTDLGRTFRGMSMIRMAEEYLGAAGQNLRGVSNVEIAERALHSTSDFANLLGNSLNRRLRMAYEENQPTYRRWARRAPNAPDFRSIDVVQLSAMPDLLKVPESGEFKYGTASDGKVSYSVITYGRIIGITRQMLVNDDLRGLERTTAGFAGSAARLENRTIYNLLIANANMPDGIALFHANHGNLGTSGLISGTTLGEGRKLMRTQKGLQGEELNLNAAFLIAPASQEQLAYQYTSSQYVPAKSSDVNEFRTGGRTALEPIIDAVLDGASATNWFMAADSAQTDTIEYCYLDGAEGVQMSSRVGFTVDGIELKASLDFAGAVIDHRGLFKNPN